MVAELISQDLAQDGTCNCLALRSCPGQQMQHDHQNPCLDGIHAEWSCNDKPHCHRAPPGLLEALMRAVTCLASDFGLLDVSRRGSSCSKTETPANNKGPSLSASQGKLLAELSAGVPVPQLLVSQRLMPRRPTTEAGDL